MKSFRQVLLGNIAFMGLSTLAAAAYAQGPQAGGANTSALGFDEIVVTARKATESLMDVPAGITVLTRGTLEQRQVVELVDIGRLVPSLNVFEGVNEAQFGLTMRGIPTVQGAEPSVAMVVDGVQAPGLAFFNQDLEGAESIEVLRGPQGALYGRGAIAGVIVINTKKPTNTFEGDVRALYGNGDTQKISANISGPVIEDKLLFKISAGHNHYGGLVPNVGYGDKADSDRSTNIRGTLLFTPTERTEITLKSDYQRLRAIGNDWEVVNRSQLDDYSIFSNYNVKPFERRWFTNNALKIEHETDIGTLLSITQYARTKDVIGGDADFSPANLFLFAQTIDNEALNQDVRYTAPQNDTFNWLVGGFYQWRTNDQPLLVSGEPGGAFDGAILLNSVQYDRSLTYAAYGQGSLTLGEYDINFALRYDIEKRLQLDRNLAGSEIEATFKALQPQASVTRRFSEEFSGYISYGRGFRSGGFNAAADVLVPRPDAPYPILRQFPKELTDNYEIGFKSQWFERRLLLNISAYHTSFKNQQYFYFFLLPTPARDIISIPKSRVNGLEVEGVWRVTSEFQIDFGMALTDAKIKDEAFDGNYISTVYRRTFNLGAEYRLEITDDTDLTLRADYQRLGPVYYDLQNTYLYDGTDLLDGKVTLRKGDFEISAFGKNILDKRFPANFLADGIAQDLSIRRRMRPATYGVEARFHF